MTKRANDLEQFDFIQFQQDAINKLKSGQPLTGKDGVMTTLIKQILEAAHFRPLANARVLKSA